jgi:hypothetical protein
MSSSDPGLKKMIELCEIHHLFFVGLLQPLARYISNRVAGDIPRVEWVIGPSRIGKTALMKALARAHPEARVDGRRRVPVLRLELSSSISPKQLPRSVLASLKVPIPRTGSAGFMFDYMGEQLHRAGTLMLLVGEASHLVEDGSKVLPSAAADWLKDVVEQLGIGLLLSGVPRLRRLIRANSQLKGRAASVRIYRPYDYDDQAEHDAFAGCVKVFVELFERAGYPISVPFTLFLMHCYLVSAGSIGMVSKFVYQLADKVTEGPARPVSFEDCAFAASRIEVAGHPSCPGFVRQTVTPSEIRQAYVYAMDDAELPLR